MPFFKLNKIEHIGIAVANIEAAKATYEALLGAPAYKEEVVSQQGVITSFFKMGESKIELLAATNPQSPIAKFIEKKGPGIHHIAFAVSDILGAIAHLKTKGFQPIYEMPQRGADQKLITFLYPKDTHGVLVELCQDAPK